ncbi:MAG: glycoside hydrolase family protein [Armatimonadota bacterium]
MNPVVKYTWFVAVAMLCASLPVCASEPLKINYIRKDIPSIPVPSFKGERYSDRVPDTLDIAERAALAVNGLTGPLDANANYELYMWVSFLTNPPTMVHDWGDWCGYKFLEALPLLRIASGSDLNKQVDPVWKDVILKSIGPDGLFYISLDGRPWGKISSCWASVVYREDGPTTVVADPTVTQLGHAYACGRILSTITIYYLRDKNPVWKQIGEKMVDRLTQIAVDKGDYCYFPDAAFEPNAVVPRDAPPPHAPHIAAESFGRLIQGPVQFYRATGYVPAIKLAGKIVNYMRYQSGYFSPDGSFQAEPLNGGKAHFHAHTMGLLGMLDYALAPKKPSMPGRQTDNNSHVDVFLIEASGQPPLGAQNDSELKAYVKKGFEWAKTNPASCSLTGFFPEWIDPAYGTCESCEVADMVALGVKLSEAGLGDYWDDVDRWTRNQFFENQLTRTDWVEDSVKSKSAPDPNPNATTDRVPERNIGAFAGTSTPNDWWCGTNAVAIMHCCTGNATRAIYYLWEHMLDCNNGTLKINLLMNRASKWADVYSYVPYEGRVDIKIKKSLKQVSVRMPEWVKGAGQKVDCSLNGRDRSFKWDGRYVDLGPVSSGDRITVTFPIYEWTTTRKVGGGSYTYTLRGNTVISVDPPGKNCPIYQREYYRGDVRWRNVKRFVSSEYIEW